MEHIKEAKILLDEELCTECTNEERVAYEEALQRFHDNIKLANYVASQYIKYDNNPRYDMDDIRQEAYKGLWLACLKFDESRGFAFSTFAVITMKGYISRMIRDNSTSYYIPRWYKDLRYLVQKHAFALPLSEEEIHILIEEGNFTRAQIMEYTEPSVVSLDSIVPGGKDSSVTTWQEIIADKSIPIEDRFSEDELEEIIDRILEYVKPCHRDIIEEYFYSILSGNKIGQAELATKYNKSQAYISRTLVKNLDILRRYESKILNLFGL